jgi:hypothetical protein
MGLEIFDAIAGAPGTYLVTDMYGNTSFGFSVDLYKFVADASGAAGAKGRLRPNIHPSIEIWNAVLGYLQDSGIGDEWFMYFYNYFTSLGPAFPPQ